MDFFQQNELRIIAKFKLGDQDSFGQIYQFYYIKLYRYAFSLTLGKVETEDIVQDVFVNLWKKRGNIKGESSLKSYLYRCVHNTFVDKYRKQGTEIKVLEEIRMQTAMTVDEDLKIHEESLLPVLKEFIEDLPKKRKKIFKMHKLQRYKYKEIAQELGISERTVEGQIRKAMATLQERATEWKSRGLLVWFVANFF